MTKENTTATEETKNKKKKIDVGGADL